MFARIISLLITLILVTGTTAAAIAPPAPQISAEAACLIVANTRRVLFEKDQNKYMYPASTTKIMTLLTALERGNLDSVVTVSPRVVNLEGSSLELRAGDQIKLRELLTGMMLVSGNDAAEMVAEHIGGSVETFVNMMNKRAVQLGTTQTHFSNPHGLPDPYNHYTTAYDLAIITAQAFKQPEFVQIVSKPKQTIFFENPKISRSLTSTNKFLPKYPGANGVKTGYTEAAGDCLVASARRQGVQLIVVILNDDERWDDAAKLLDYGFQVLGVGQNTVPDFHLRAIQE